MAFFNSSYWYAFSISNKLRWHQMCLTAVFSGILFKSDYLVIIHLGTGDCFPLKTSNKFRQILTPHFTFHLPVSYLYHANIVFIIAPFHNCLWLTSNKEAGGSKVVFWDPTSPNTSYNKLTFFISSDFTKRNQTFSILCLTFQSYLSPNASNIKYIIM